jgi:mono/diheme cytochrome c family protein
MKIFKVSLVCAAFALFIFACSENKPANTNSTNAVVTNTNKATDAQPTAPAEVLADARKIYSEKCAGCHKEDGTGGKKVIEGKTINADNFTTDKMAAMADEKYFDYIKNGVADEGMPAFKNQLSDEQIKSVVKFIRKEFQKK